MPFISLHFPRPVAAQLRRPRFLVCATFPAALSAVLIGPVQAQSPVLTRPAAPDLPVNQTNRPQLTLGSQPQSAIAPSLAVSSRMSFTPSRFKTKSRTPLMISLPQANGEIRSGEVKNGATPVVIGKPVSQLPQTASAPPMTPVPWNQKASAGPLASSREDLPASIAVPIPAKTSATAPSASASSGATTRTSSRLVTSRSASPLPVIEAPATNSTELLGTSRDGAARLPSRGGLIVKPQTVPTRIEAPVVESAPMVSDSQRQMLARLDVDLGRAQSRLSRAETRLSEGQKQLGSFTDVLRSAMLEAGDEAHGLHPFVRVAQRYLGTPYVWGGESARGFDCSGFIMRVMRDLGYRALPHSAAEQFRYGLPVAKPLLKAGDIVFFANTYKPGISHVGIYLGRGRFIHAANSHVGTIVSSLSEPKWVEKYAGARRLLPTNS